MIISERCIFINVCSFNNLMIYLNVCQHMVYRCAHWLWMWRFGSHQSYPSFNLLETIFAIPSGRSGFLNIKMNQERWMTVVMRSKFWNSNVGFNDQISYENRLRMMATFCNLGPFIPIFLVNPQDVPLQESQWYGVA